MSIILIDATSDSLTLSWPEGASTVTSSSTNNNNNKTLMYHLQYRLNSSSSDNNNNNNHEDDDDDQYVTLSNTLRTTTIRKKNLIDTDNKGFIFRVCRVYPNNNIDNNNSSSSNNNWMTHTEPFYLLSKIQDQYKMKSPHIQYGGTNASLCIHWKSFTNPTILATNDDTMKDSNNDNNNSNTVIKCISYEIQMREYSGGIPWTTIVSNYVGNKDSNKNETTTTHDDIDQQFVIRKNNCTSIYGYQFRIRPIITPLDNCSSSSSSSFSSKTDDSLLLLPFSSPSEPPIIPLSYMTTQLGLQQRLRLSSLSNNTLLSNSLSKGGSSNNGNSIVKRPVMDMIGGKELILLYVSAHWCGPCRQYTPKLIQWYNSIVGCNNNNSKNNTNNKNTIVNTSFMEIIFISADHDYSSFQSYYQTMPWTAIDYETDSNVREYIMSPNVLNVRGIPQLAVICGRTGNILQTNMVGQSLQKIQEFRKT